jgi:hypothetical protein
MLDALMYVRVTLCYIVCRLGPCDVSILKPRSPAIGLCKNSFRINSQMEKLKFMKARKSEKKSKEG